MNIKNTINSVINAEKKIVNDVVEAKIKTSHYIVEHIKGIIKTTITMAIAVCVTFALTYVYNMESTVNKLSKQNSELMPMAAEVKKIREKEKEDQRIGEYVLFVMNFSKFNTSDFQKQLLAQSIVRASGNIFDTEEERKWSVVLVNNESGFNKDAKSPAGAIGLTQVMAPFIEEFGGHCGIKGVSSSEVSEVETNLILGFCRFKHLLKCYNGVYSTALAAYNGGKNARSVKELQSLSKITTTETLQYIARFTHVLATANANEKDGASKLFNNNTNLKVSSNRSN